MSGFSTLESTCDTHVVENQPPLLQNENLFTCDRFLQESVKSEGGGGWESMLDSFGAYLGREETLTQARQAHQFPPVFQSHDRRGERYDFVEFHPSYHAIFAESVKRRVHCLPWADPQPGAHVARAALLYLDYQIEPGHVCPVTMTYGCVPAIQKQPEIWNEWREKIFSAEYDPRLLPMPEKKGALIGMAMTEKQGGSDIRSNTTQATPIGAAGPGNEYLLDGHKWFCSHPMADAFLMLAQTSKGPSCFFVPRWLPDGRKNNILIQRLKDKLGDRSNASSEIELKGTWGRLIGEEGRGIPIIIEMANYTRLDCAVASSGLMRQALRQALHYTENRHAFGAPLYQQPMMQRLLGDLILESESATLLAMRMARAYDRQDDDQLEGPFRRIATAIAKYWLTKRSVSFSYECMEVMGGTGYVEESSMPRIYRQAPLNSIWEGSGNVMCLDVLRAMHKEPQSLEALRSELNEVAGKSDAYDRSLSELEKQLKTPEALVSQARFLVERIALLLQASLWLKHSETDKCEAFLKDRLPNGPATFGALRGSYDFAHWIENATNKS